MELKKGDFVTVKDGKFFKSLVGEICKVDEINHQLKYPIRIKTAEGDQIRVAYEEVIPVAFKLYNRWNK